MSLMNAEDPTSGRAAPTLAFHHVCTTTSPSPCTTLLRIDVDVFAATLDALAHLYPRLTPGGVVLFDDWKLPLARRAAEEYRRSNGITAEIRFLPGTVDAQAYWVKP